MPAPKKPAPPTSIQKWDEEMARLATAAADIEKNVGGGSFLGTQGGILTYKSTPVPNNNIDVVVVHHIMENSFYEGTFNPNNPQPPVCFAFGEDEDSMTPHEKATKPQHENCKECPQNQWGSADVGRGKACKNTRRIAIITEADLTNSVPDAEVVYLRPPVTSVKGWAGYVKSLAETIHRPPLGVVTNISMAPDPKTQFKVLFKLKHQIDDSEQIGALLEKRKSVAAEIDFPYLPMADAPPPAKANARQPAQRAKYAR